MARLTRILGILRANVVIACIQDILVHERCAGGDLSKEGYLDWLADLHALAFLYKDLASVLASIFAVEGWDAVLFGVVALFEGLESGHEVVSTSDTVCDDTLCDAGSHSTLDDGGDGVHGADDLGLKLRWHVEFDLLEEVF